MNIKPLADRVFRLLQKKKQSAVLSFLIQQKKNHCRVKLWQ